MCVLTKIFLENDCNGGYNITAWLRTSEVISAAEDIVYELQQHLKMLTKYNKHFSKKCTCCSCVPEYSLSRIDGFKFSKPNRS